MKKITASLIAALLLVAGFSSQPANAACGMTGSGTSGDPWIILTAANLSKVGVIAVGECATTQNQHQHYKLGADIALTGNFTPINLSPSSPYTGSFDGNKKSISGLAVTGVNYAGLFAGLGAVSVQDLKITGTSVVSSGGSAGTLAGYAQGTTITNVVTQLTGNVGSGSTQQAGGLIGNITNCSITNSSFKSTAGAVKGTSYIGGAFGNATGSTISDITVSSDIVASNISGGIVGSFTPGANTEVSRLFYSGSLIGDQYVGGLIGYLWSSGNYSVDLNNSAVKGTIATATASYTPSSMVGHMGNGITFISISKNYSAANYLTNTNVSAATVPVIEGNGITIIGNTYHEPWGAGTSMTGSEALADGVFDEISEVPSNWAAVQQDASVEVVGNYVWVLDGSASPLNGGRPMPLAAYNTGFFGNLQCAGGRFSVDGNIPCIPAEAGTYVALPGQTASVDCPVGTYQASTGQLVCLQSPVGSYVANLRSLSATPCPSGYTSVAGATVCTLIPSSGGGSAAVAKPALTSLPKLNGAVVPGKTIEVSVGTWSSTTPIQYSYAWYLCSHPVVATANLAEEFHCVAIEKATDATLGVKTDDTKKFITAKVTASNAGGSASYVASSVNAKTIKYLALVSPAKVSGTAQVGKVLSVSSLKWLAVSPTKTSYQWYRCPTPRTSGVSIGGSCKPISGATKNTYRQSTADRSKFVSVKVTATLGTSKVTAVAGSAKKSS